MDFWSGISLFFVNSICNSVCHVNLVLAESFTTWFLKRSQQMKRAESIFAWLKLNWAAKHQTSWDIAPWWFCVSLWRICIPFVWPSGSQKLPAPSSRSERHLHFASIRLCMALWFIISITAAKTHPFICQLTFINEKLEIKKTKPTFIIPVLKVEYLLGGLT